MFTFFIILLILVIINVSLLFFSVSKIEQRTDTVPELYAFEKSNKKQVEEEELPAYRMYKKAI